MPRVDAKQSKRHKKDTGTDGKARRTEDKRARGSISCAECRRLKLKCSKTVPCDTCLKRGCESICPNGKLISGQGTRMLLASPDQLLDKISQMNDRIDQLEDALIVLQPDGTGPAPSSSYAVSGSDMSAAEANGASRPETSRETAASQHKEPVDTPGPSAQIPAIPAVAGHTQPQPPPSSRVSPLGLRQQYSFLLSSLPPWPRARELRDIFLPFRIWGIGSVTHRQLCDELLPFFYVEAAGDGAAGGRAPFPTTSSSEATERAHDLAVLLAVFALAALMDTSLPAAPENTEGALYFEAAHTVLSRLAPVLDCAPCFSTIQALCLMGQYRGLSNHAYAYESTWYYNGLAGKLSQSIGLHRDVAQWKLPASQTEKMRNLFWELQKVDHWISLGSGKVPTFVIGSADCALPSEEYMSASEGGAPSDFPMWKMVWVRDILVPLSSAFTGPSPPYATIMKLDREIRARGVPPFALGAPPADTGLLDFMAYYVPRNYHEYALIYLHRTYFAQSMYDSPRDPARSRRAFSFESGFDSARTVLRLLRAQFARYPAEVARVYFLWTHTYSAAVMLASIAIMASHSVAAPTALLELQQALDLFEKASVHGGRAEMFLPILRRLHTKAAQKVTEAQSSIQAPPPMLTAFPAPSRRAAAASESQSVPGPSNSLSTMSYASSNNAPPVHAAYAHPQPPRPYTYYSADVLLGSYDPALFYGGDRAVGEPEVPYQQQQQQPATSFAPTQPSYTHSGYAMSTSSAGGGDAPWTVTPGQFGDDVPDASAQAYGQHMWAYIMGELQLPRDTETLVFGAREAET